MQSSSNLLVTLLLCLSLFVPLSVSAVPDIEEIEQDQKTFRQFFQNRFPDLGLAQYSGGAAALPQFSRQRPGHQLLMSFPPYETAIKEARLFWKQPLANGATLSDCFSGKPPPTAYPFIFDGAVHTIEGDINRCLLDNGSPALDPAGNQLAAIVAAYKDPFRGQPVDIDIRDTQVRAMYEKGKQYFWAKRGQMNLSCANCHVHNAGNQLRGDVLSAALGHGAGSPAYSITQNDRVESGNAGGMQTLHQRYAQCNIITGAAPLPAQSDSYIALELYQAIMNAGLPLGAPGLRQ